MNCNRRSWYSYLRWLILLKLKPPDDIVVEVVLQADVVVVDAEVGPAIVVEADQQAYTGGVQDQEDVCDPGLDRQLNIDVCDPGLDLEVVVADQVNDVNS